MRGLKAAAPSKMSWSLNQFLDLSHWLKDMEHHGKFDSVVFPPGSFQKEPVTIYLCNWAWDRGMSLSKDLAEFLATGSELTIQGVNWQGLVAQSAITTTLSVRVRGNNGALALSSSLWVYGSSVVPYCSWVCIGRDGNPLQYSCLERSRLAG